MLKWLYRILNAVPPEEREGIPMGANAYWEVDGEPSFPAFLHALPDLVPEASILYVEDGEHPKELKIFLEARSVAPRSKVAVGTIWPRPKAYHLPADKGFLEDFAELSKRCDEPEICSHLHVYMDDEILLRWYNADAPGDIPIRVSKRIPEEKLRSFCARLGLTYREP